ncbi:MAG: helix-turn-helix transcriptional regulator [Nanoarchaeota archaeon]
MNQKHIGAVLIITGIILGLFIYSARIREEKLVDAHMQQTGSCFLEDGTCLHAELNSVFYVLGWAFSGVLVLFGIYLSFVDKTQEFMVDHHNKISEALKIVSNRESEKDAFNAFLSVFGDNEKNVLKVIHSSPDGITQSTLRYRADVSKTALSMMLKGFEERGIISRKVEGKTNRVFFVKKF